MNERGVSLVEAMLAVSILFLLTLTLIPFMYQMQQLKERKIAAYYASEIAYNGALLVQRYGMTAGTQRLNGILYEWYYDGRAICTAYRVGEEAIERCIS